MTPAARGEGSDGCRKSFLGHLEDLRATILWCVGLLLCGMLAAIPLAPSILGILKVPLESTGVDPESFLQVIRVAGGISVGMKIVFWAGLLISLPFMSLAIGLFVFPGLTRRERRAVVGAMGFAAVLFTAGVWMGYSVTLPIAMQVLFRVNAWLGVACEFVHLSDYVSFVLKLLLAFGLSFELPVVVLLLGHLGILSSSDLREKRPYVIVALLVIAMLLTPPDPVTQILMALPLALLYEGCIWVIWFRERGGSSRSL